MRGMCRGCKSGCGIRGQRSRGFALRRLTSFRNQLNQKLEMAKTDCPADFTRPSAQLLFIDGLERRAGPWAARWYLQYSKIAPGLKVLPPDAGRKNPIHFILRRLGGPYKAAVMPRIRAEVLHAFDQTALPHDRSRCRAGGSVDAVCRHIARQVRARDAARAHGDSRDSGSSSGNEPEQTGRPL